MSQAGRSVDSGSLTAIRSGNDWVITVPNSNGEESKIYRGSHEAIPDQSMGACTERGTREELEQNPAPFPHPLAKLLYHDEDHTVFATDPNFQTNEPVQVWIDGRNFVLGNRALIHKVIAHENVVLIEYMEHEPDHRVFSMRVGIDHRKILHWDGAEAVTHVTTSGLGHAMGPQFFDGKPWFAVAVDEKEPIKGFRIRWGEEVSKTLYSICDLQNSGNEPLYIASIDSTRPNGHTSCLIRGVTIIDRGEMDSYGKQGERVGNRFLLVNGQAAYTRSDVPYHQTPWFDSPKSILVEGRGLGHFSAVYLLWADGKTLRAVVAGDDGVPTEVSYEIADR